MSPQPTRQASSRPPLLDLGGDLPPGFAAATAAVEAASAALVAELEDKVGRRVLTALGLLTDAATVLVAEARARSGKAGEEDVFSTIDNEPLGFAPPVDFDPSEVLSSAALPAIEEAENALLALLATARESGDWPLASAGLRAGSMVDTARRVLGR